MKSSYRGLLLSLLRQTAINNDGVHPLLQALYKKCKSGDSLPETKDLEDVFKKAAADWGIYIVIDAMDECSESHPVVQFLQEIPETCKIIVTSRYMAQDLNLWTNIKLNTRAITGDIEIYLKDKLNIRKWSEKLYGEVYSALVKGAQGQ